MKSLSVTVCRRPEYTEQVLGALLKCDGIDSWSVAVFIDRQCDRTVELVRRLAPTAWAIHESTGPLGCNANVLRAMQHGFGKSEYHVHLEDDTVPVRDTLNYFAWASQFGCDERLLGVTAYSRIGGDACEAVMLGAFCPWGFATWRDRFAEFDANWCPEPKVSWDTWIDGTMQRGRLLVTPCLSRIQNVGQHAGTFNTPDMWAKEQFNPTMAAEDSAVSEWRLLQPQTEGGQ